MSTGYGLQSFCRTCRSWDWCGREYCARTIGLKDGSFGEGEDAPGSDRGDDKASGVSSGSEGGELGVGVSNVASGAGGDNLGAQGSGIPDSSERRASGSAELAEKPGGSNTYRYRRDVEKRREQVKRAVQRHRLRKKERK